MKHYRLILIIGTLEVLIGGMTLFGVLFSLIFSFNTKSPNILAFVVLAGTLSMLIGFGILRCNIVAYKLLLYFSSVVALSKLLMFMGVIHLSGALETIVPMPIKDFISIMYHGFVIYYLKKPGIKEIFHR